MGICGGIEADDAQASLSKQDARGEPGDAGADDRNVVARSGRHARSVRHSAVVEIFLYFEQDISVRLV